ncbi:MAG: SDR family NAD(P)-dependent oxidoreductase [Myxococcaceae bacterium]|nr:SDR family NAD(P)-dependent oxidoreductase [Myxococcaceae bacterium]
MKDQVIVITGASEGIGAALAKHVSRLGALPVLAARREAALNQVAKECLGALIIAGDLTVRANVEAVAKAALAQHRRIDVWVNNVGRGISRPVSELTDEDLQQMLDANVKSALYGMQAVLPHFKSRGQGHLINVSSVLGRVPYVAVRSAYSASKHFLNALTASLRLELALSHPHIHVSTVSPGVVATGFGLNALHGGVDSRALPRAQSADDVARVIAETIATPKADVYTRREYQQQVMEYFGATDMGALEREWVKPR